MKCKQLALQGLSRLAMLATLIVGPMFCYTDLYAQQTPTLKISTLSDSKNTMGMHYTARKFVDQNCKKPKKKAKIFRKKFSKAEEEFKSVDLIAGTQFFLQIEYQEKRRLEERSCNYLIGFVPAPDTDYTAQYEVKGQVSACTIELINNQTQKPVEIEVVRPQHWCKKNGSNGSPNGVAEHKILQRF